jgi:phosphoglycerate dehydrogenase-like enzyme
LREPAIGVVIPTKPLGRILAEAARAALEKLGRVTWAAAEDKVTPEEAVRVLAGCEIGIGSWGTPNPRTEGLLAACPHLKLWVHAAGSVKAMFGPHLEGRDLVIASCAPAIAEQVAETTLGLLIVGVRRVLENAAANRRGKAGWPPNSKDLDQATIGLVGAGQVGRRVIANLRPFGPRILLFDPYVSPQEAKALGVEKRPTVADLCRECDALSLHAPANPDCAKMVGPAEFAAMKDDCILVNTARGALVDEAALIEELQKGRFFAFLDVTAPEPAAADSPLRRLPNVVLTSHIAGGPTPKIGNQVVRDVQAWVRGEPLTMAVTADMLARIA